MRLGVRHSTQKMSTRIFNGNAIAAYITLLLLLVGCKTQFVEVEKPVVVEHTSATNHTDIVRDTLIMRDSVYHLVKGDTLIIEKWHHINTIHNVSVSDTVHDSIPIIKEVKVPVEIEKKLTRWQQAKMDFGGGSIAFAALILIGFIIYIVVKLRKIV